MIIDTITIQRAHLSFERADAPIIDIRNSFQVEKGLNLLVAQSGSGKTSLMRLLSGWFAKKDDTQIAVEFVANYDFLSDVEFIGNHQTLLPWFSLRSNIAIRGGDISRAEAYCEALGLGPATMNKFPYELSLGMYKRAELVAAFSHNTRLLLLDEFFSSLDPEARAASMSLIETHSATSGAVLISTHSPEAFPQVSSRLGFIYGSGRQIVEVVPLL